MTEPRATAEPERPIDRPVTLVQPTGRRMAAGLVPDIIVSGILPIVLTNILLNNGVAPVPALVAGGIFPLLSNIISIARTRRASVIGVISLTFIIVGAISSLVSGDPRFTLAKNSFFTGVYGAIFLVSIVVGKPLMFVMGRQFVAGNDPERVAHWNGMWQYPRFRQIQRTMTAVWGFVLIAEAAVRIVLVYAFSIPVNVMQIIAELLSWTVIIGLIAWTTVYGKRKAADRERARQAALAAQQAA